MSNKKIRYCVGFAFSENFKSVLLIKKDTKNKEKRLRWMHGKYNGIGGHCENGETPIRAMRREFLEETGLKIKNWKKFGEFEVKRGVGGIIYLFTTQDDQIFYAKSPTKEEVRIFGLDHELNTFSELVKKESKIVPNTVWLLGMAANSLNRKDSCSMFSIKELN